jgi:Domain of unknown function (DUF4347)/Cadherin-like domain
LKLSLYIKLLLLAVSVLLCFKAVGVSGANNQTILAAKLNSNDHVFVTATRDSTSNATVFKPKRMQNLVIVDGALLDQELLLEPLLNRTDIEIRFLPLDGDALSGVGAIIRNYHDLKTVHILSHGSEGELQLLGHRLNAETLFQEKEFIKDFSGALANDGEVLLYGCNIGMGAKGQIFVDTLAKLLGRPVAASTNKTGNQKLGGDWVLERRSANLHSATLNLSQWNSVLSQNTTGIWTPGTNTGSNSITVGSSTVTTTVSFSGFTTATTAASPITVETFNNIAVFNPSVQGGASLGVQYFWDTVPEAATNSASADGGNAIMTITFSHAVKDPILHIDRIGGSDGTNQNGMAFTLQTSGVTLTRLSGTTHFSVSGAVITNGQIGQPLGTGYSAESNTNQTLGTASGSVRLNGTFTTVSFLMSPGTNSTEGAGADAFEIATTFDPVPDAQPDSYNGYVNTAYTGNLLSNNGSGVDSDFNTDTLTISKVNSAAFTVGTPIVLSNGNLTITNASSGAFSFSPSNGFFGTQTFTYSISDANGGVSTATASLNILHTTLTISTVSMGGVTSFTYSGANGWSNQTQTTTTAGTAVTGATQTFTTPNTATTITQSIPVGYVLTNLNCTGLGSGTATPNLSAGTISFDAAALAPSNIIQCTFSDSKLPTLTLTEVTTLGVGTFSFTGNNGFTNQSITTSTAGVGVTGATQILANLLTATTITQAANSNFLFISASCTGLSSGTATVNSTARSISFQAASLDAGAAVQCTLNNQHVNPQLAILKTASTAGPVSVGQIITYTYKITNTGNVPFDNVFVSDTHNGYGTSPVPYNEQLTTDAAPTGDSLDSATNGIWNSLAPGDSVTFSSNYTVVQTDIDYHQ